MNQTVKKIVDISADAHGWDRASPRGAIQRYEKDGYEVYFFRQDDGFELTIRNPETMERQTMLEVRDENICTTSPAYVALLEHVLRNAENIVSECSTKQ